MTDPNTDINKDVLKDLLGHMVWDYNISEDELLEIFLQSKTGHSMIKADIDARLLGYYNWHLLIRVLGYKGAFALLNDNAIAHVFSKIVSGKIIWITRHIIRTSCILCRIKYYKK